MLWVTKNFVKQKIPCNLERSLFKGRKAHNRIRLAPPPPQVLSALWLCQWAYLQESRTDRHTPFLPRMTADLLVQSS